jgi:CHRD domain
MTMMRRLSAVLLPTLATLVLAGGAAAAPPAAKNFVSPMSGDEEVPPVDTNATGNAVYKLDEAAGELHFRLIVANIENVTQAHIHCGARGVNGPVVVFLFPDAPPPDPGVTVNGILAQGTRTNADVIPRPDSPECPGGVSNLEDVIAKMRSGDAYTNVHTVVNPGGEIRGQIRGAGPS